jgi:hypothetical protein
VWRFPLSCRFLSDEHLFPQQKAVGHRFFLRPSTRPFRSPYCSGLLYECVCVTPSLFHVTSTYWKHASGTSPLDLPLVGVSTFLEGPVASPDHVQVEDSSGSHGALSSLQAPASVLQRLDVHLHLHPEGFFFFGSPCTLRDFIAVTSSPYFDMTSFLPLRLHVDRGLVRHGYPWVPIDQGPRGPCQVDPTCQKTS